MTSAISLARRDSRAPSCHGSVMVGSPLGHDFVMNEPGRRSSTNSKRRIGLGASGSVGFEGDRSACFLDRRSDGSTKLTGWRSDGWGLLVEKHLQDLRFLIEKLVRLGVDDALGDGPERSKQERQIRDVAAISHSVHGAMGITQAFDLQLYTRRIRALRLNAGSESYWARILGQERMLDSTTASVAWLVDTN